MTLLSILLATLLGGVLSVLAAAALSFSVLSRWAPRLVSYAVGVLLGAAFLDLLPEAVNALGPEDVLATCLAGILAFFVLEKLALWRHAHAEAPDADPREAAHRAHTHHRIQPAGPMIVIGDALHNFVDGVLIAAAFLSDPAIGWAVAIGVVAHEIPQEVGDFMVLLGAGYTRRRALLLNALSGAAAVLGGVIGYFALAHAEQAVPYALAFSAASFIYIAVADLIPELHRRWDLKDAAMQVVLIGAGVATLEAVHGFAH